MKKILLVTGRVAENNVKKQIGKRSDCEVYVSKTDIASLLSVETIIRELKNRDLSNISMILVPGTIRGDVSKITKELGIKCFKGSRHIADLPIVLDLAYTMELSSELPADEVLKERIMQELELKSRSAFRKPRLMIRELGIGTGITHVLAEIPDAVKLSDEELVQKARYYVNSGAAIIDVGMVSGEDNSKRIGHVFDVLKNEVRVPLSIDSLNENEILAGVDAGADLVLSIDESNLHILSNIDVPAVVIPRDKKGLPKEPSQRVKLLEDLLERIKNMGFEKVIADPILEPVNMGFVRSMTAYHLFREKHPDMPMLMGAGNVTELFDADSIGINALLAGACHEMDIDLVFTTEASRKTIGSVSELVKAAKMMHIAGIRGQVPKDIYIDLLYFKNKRCTDVIPDTTGINFTDVGKNRITHLEEHVFRIYLTDKINIIYYKGKEPIEGFRGTDSRDLYKEIVSRINISAEHAAYLGKELYKAELALRLGKCYIQDKELF